MFALIFGFTLLGVPLIVFVALNPTTIVVIAAFAVQLAACAIGVVWILRAFSDDERPDEPHPDEGAPQIARRSSGPSLGRREPDSLRNRLPCNEAANHPVSTQPPPPPTRRRGSREPARGRQTNEPA
jgi:hypothetical protein